MSAQLVPNNGGGLSFEVDDATRLRRFLILGAEGGTYYVRANKHAFDNTMVVMRLIAEGRGLEVVEAVVKISTEGRAAKQTPGLFALAICSRFGDVQTRRAARAAISEVCRTASTLMQYLKQDADLGKAVASLAQEDQSVSKPGRNSWGRSMRREVSNWYLNKSPMALAYQVTKYAQREGWSHRDLLRVAHPNPAKHFNALKRKLPVDAAGNEDVLMQEPAAEVGDLSSVANGTSDDVTLVQEAAAEDEDKVTVALKKPKHHNTDQLTADFEALFAYITKKALPTGPAAAGLAPSQKLVDYLTAAATLKQVGQPASKDAPVRAVAEGLASQVPAAHAAATDAVIPAAAPAEPEPAAVDEAAAAQEFLALETAACSHIRLHKFTWEHIGDTRLLKSATVWSTLLECSLPLGALLRNLGRMTALGVFEAKESEVRACSRLTDQSSLHSARLHPLVILEAMRTYAAGKGEKGSTAWTPNSAISAALEDAFYLAYRSVQPTGKRIMVALDVSGSMSGGTCAGMRLTPCEAGAALTMAILHSEPNVTTVAFSDKLVPLPFSKEDRLDAAIAKGRRLNFGRTDCAAPMVYAQERGLSVDIFVVITDSETNCNSVAPHVALQRYRTASGIHDAKLAVLATSATEFTIADPSDRGMLDVAGMDSAVPQLLRDFALNQL